MDALLPARDPPLILFSGMGADERVFAVLRDAFPTLVVPRWIAPLRSESLTSYSARFAKALDPACPFYIGGASFGGMVALEAARRVPNVLGCFLIGSIRSPLELPRRLRALRAASGAAGLLPFGLLPGIARCACSVLGRRAAPAGMLRQAAASDAEFLRWACRAVLNWQPDPRPFSFPVHQVHGGRDPILPHRLTHPDVLIPDGGHVLTLSHPTQVSGFIRRFMKRDAEAGHGAPDP